MSSLERLVEISIHLYRDALLDKMKENEENYPRDPELWHLTKFEINDTADEVLKQIRAAKEEAESESASSELGFCPYAE